jgi:hypothetical protein
MEGLGEGLGVGATHGGGGLAFRDDKARCVDVWDPEMGTD